MAHIDGDTLQNLLGSDDHLGISECVELFAPIANCLDYIHGQGVIHRNVKPANIIVKRPRGAALSDFSLAQTRTPSKFILRARVAGTPTFMSPEQARGEAVDGRSDLFSFGCILFQCLSGVKPFRGKNPNETMALIIGPDPPRQVDWETLGKPAALDGFFRRALAKDANERFASGAELIDAMSALAADSETASPETLEPLDPEKLKMIREERARSRADADDLRRSSRCRTHFGRGLRLVSHRRHIESATRKLVRRYSEPSRRRPPLGRSVWHESSQRLWST